MTPCEYDFFRKYHTRTRSGYKLRPGITQKQWERADARFYKKYEKQIDREAQQVVSTIMKLVKEDRLKEAKFYKGKATHSRRKE